MGTPITIRGRLKYRDDATLRAAVAAAEERIRAAVADYGASVLAPEHLVRDRLWVAVDVSGFCPASSSFEAEAVVAVLADAALSGFIDMDFDEGDGFRVWAKPLRRTS